MLLDHKVAVITGAGSGIGEAISKLFAEEGANVIVCDRNETEAERVASELNGRACAIKAEVSSEAEVKHKQTVRKFSRIGHSFPLSGLRISQSKEKLGCP